MRWQIAIGDIVGDQRFLRDLLEKLDISTHIEMNKIYIGSERWNSLEFIQVWQECQQIRDTIVNVSKVLSFTIQLDGVKENGLPMHIGFASSNFSIGVIGCSTLVNVIPKSDISVEEISRLEIERKAQLEKEYQQKLAKDSSLILLILQDDIAKKVWHLLNQELTPLFMGHIVDLICKDMGGNSSLEKFVNKKDLDQFYGSINHPTVFGHNSRHMTSKNNNKPPKHPMTLSEAKEFTYNIANLWLRYKCNSQNNYI